MPNTMGVSGLNGSTPGVHHDASTTISSHTRMGGQSLLPNSNLLEYDSRYPMGRCASGDSSLQPRIPLMYLPERGGKRRKTRRMPGSPTRRSGEVTGAPSTVA